MSTDSGALQSASDTIRDDQTLVSNLQPTEAQILAAWGQSELAQSYGTLDERTTRVRAAMAEINDLVGNKMTLVSDDIEERMAMLLVGDLDAGALVRLQIEREIAQVTAEKDHLSDLELVRQFTALASQAWQSKAAHASQVLPLAPRAAATAQVKVHADDAALASATETGIQATKAARQRPIPRPTPIPPRSRGFLSRLFGGR